MSSRSSLKSVFTRGVLELRRLNTKRLWALKRARTLVPALVIAVAATLIAGMLFVQAANQTWSGGGTGNGTAWFTTTNWVGGAFPGSQSVTTNTDIATVPATGTNPNLGINMNFAGNTLYVGAIDFTSTANRGIGDSSATAGTLQLNGATVNSVANVIVRNSAIGTLTLVATQAGTMQVALGNTTDNVINIDGTGGITISSIIKNAGGNHITVGGAGAGTLTLAGANTYTGGTTISSARVIGNANGALGAGNVTVNTTGVGLTLQGAFNNFIADTATVNIASGAMMALNQTGGSDTVAGLVLGGVTQTTLGTYGSSASGAANQFDSFFTGTGTLTLGPADTAPTVSSTTPINNATNVAVNSDVAINFSEPVNVSASSFTISCGTSGAHTFALSGSSAAYTLNPNADFANNETCTVTVVAAQVTDQDAIDPPDNMAADYVFSFTTVAAVTCGAAYTPIYTIQGSGTASPIVGTSVTTEGVVIGDFQGSSNLSGFYIQEPTGDGNTATSEGIFIFDGASPAVDVAVGDRVRVSGTVSEQFNNTQINPVTLLGVCNTGNPLPAATAYDLPEPVNNDLERVENMLVTFPETLTVTGNFTEGRFGELVLSSDGRLFQQNSFDRPGTAGSIAVAALNARRYVLLDDGKSGQNLDPTPYFNATPTRRLGDTTTGLTGVLTFDFSEYRIQPTGPVTFADANPRPPAPTTLGSIKAVGMNVLNYFNGNGAGGGFPTSRGANTLAEFNRQRDKIIAAIIAINPDVLGISEMENDGVGATSAIQDLVNGLNAASAPGTYTFVNEPGPGTDEIKVSIIYKPGVLSPVGAAVNDPNPIHNRPPLAQTFQQISTGQAFNFIVNHFKSKGGTCPGSGGDADAGDGQGCFNATRVAQANALLTFIQARKTASGDPDVLSVGDYNSYGEEDPMFTLEQDAGDTLADGAGGLISLTKEYIAVAERYSYQFDSESGELDHAMATKSMDKQTTGTFVWHNNADEPIVLDYNVEFKSVAQQALNVGTPYRTSDHDPVVVGIFLVSPTAADSTITGRIADRNGVPVAGAVVNLSGTQNRKTITDANGNYRFDNVETTGFYTVRATRVNYSFSPQERSFSQLGNQTEAAFTATPLATAINPLDTPEYFVRQHYLDFLGREPDEAGFNFWSDQILGCGGDAGCVEVKRINVSAAYFLSIEFQETGGLVDGLYRASFERAPKYAEFMPDTVAIAKGMVVGRAGWEQQLTANKQAFLEAYVGRPAFQSIYGSLSNDQYVDQLLTHTRIIWTQAERAALVNGLASGTLTRAAVLGQIAADQRFVAAKSNEAFVMMEYFGYLRRDPDAAGYQYWLDKLNQFNGNFEQAEMVKAFIVSIEYRERFPR